MRIILTSILLPIAGPVVAQTVDAWQHVRDAPKVALDNPGTVAVLLMGAIYSIMKLRRRVSRDSVEIVKDRQETDLFAAYQKERETLIVDRDAAHVEARKAWVAYNEASVENAKIKSDNYYQLQEIERLKTIVSDIKVTFDREELRWEQERERLSTRFEEVQVRLQELSRGVSGKLQP